MYLTTFLIIQLVLHKTIYSHRRLFPEILLPEICYDARALGSKVAEVTFYVANNQCTSAQLPKKILKLGKIPKTMANKKNNEVHIFLQRDRR